MKKWDCLVIDFNKMGLVEFQSTKPDEINTLVEKIITEGTIYFSYVNVGKHRIEIKKYPSDSTVKGHRVRIMVTPTNTQIFEDNIHADDFNNFILNMIILNDWLPYPGDGTGTRFIKYYE